MTAIRILRLLALAASALLVASIAIARLGFAATTDCRDVRTGAAFTVPMARFTSSGVGLPEGDAADRLCVGAVRGTHAVPIADPAGGAFVAWVEAAGEDCDLRVQHLGPSGEPKPGWPNTGRLLCGARGSQTQPALAVGAEGRLWAAWRDYRDPQHSAIYLTLLALSGEPISGLPVDGILVSEPGASASDPQLVPDASGGVWLVWVQGAAHAHGLLLKHFGPDAMLAPGWPTGGKPLTSGQTDAVHPLASADSAGGMALAWTTASPGASQLRLLLLDASGTASSGWAEGGGIIGASSGLLLPAALSATPNGLHLAWSELFQDSVAARVVRVERDGVLSTGWSAGGLALASTEHVSQPALQEDGLGGAYVAWIGTPVAGTGGGVRLTRLNAAGTASAGWPADGILVAANRPDSYRPRLLRAEDGVLISWSESESRSEGTLLNAAMAALGSLPELERVEPWPDLVRVAWRTNGEARYDVLVERQESSGEWAPLHELNREATGALKLEDREVSAGSVVSYRLRLRSPELELVTAEVRVEVPAAAPLALRGLAIQNGRLRLVATVSSRAESRFELFDVQGRRLLRDVRTHEHAGEVTLDWPVPDGVRAGVFFARLSQGRESKTRRFVLGR